MLNLLVAMGIGVRGWEWRRFWTDFAGYCRAVWRTEQILFVYGGQILSIWGQKAPVLDRDCECVCVCVFV